jgi:hypothetical protein
MKSFHQQVRDLKSGIDSGLRPTQKPFSLQSKSQQRLNLKTLKRVVALTSGGDCDAILKKLCASKFIPSLVATMPTPHSKCLDTIREQFSTAETYGEKKQLLSLVANSYPAAFLKSQNFQFGSNLFHSAKEYAT